MEEKDNLNEENRDNIQSQTSAGCIVPTENVDTSSMLDGLSEAGGIILGGIIESVGSIISNIND